MNRGMLWFDNDPKTNLEKKLAAAVAYYRQKYGRTPNLCMVNPSMLGEEHEFDGVVVKSYRPVLPGHLWIGCEAKKRIERPVAAHRDTADG